VLFSHAVSCTPEILVLAREEGGNEIVLLAEMPIEAGLGDACFGGYLRVLTEKATAGEFSVGPMLMAALRAQGQTKRGEGRLR
jgi:hypothetical protein